MNEMQNNIIRAPISSEKVKGLYDLLSPIYEYLTRYERIAKSKGIDVANIKPRSRVLEVAVGTGKTLREISQRIGEKGLVCGIDLSPKMLETTRSGVQKVQLSPPIHLKLGDARYLPYQSDMFDVVFNSYLLDLIDTPDIHHVLAEFKRVLKPGGRLVVVSLSKGDRWYSNMRVYEWIYRQCPELLGGCRPVFTKSFIDALGFQNVNRELLLAGHIIPSEIVWGDKPRES